MTAHPGPLSFAGTGSAYMYGGHGENVVATKGSACLLEHTVYTRDLQTRGALECSPVRSSEWSQCVSNKVAILLSILMVFSPV